MLETRRCYNSFIEVECNELKETCFSKKEAIKLKENLSEVIEDLQSFIDESDH